jgi:hypothetical protein
METFRQAAHIAEAIIECGKGRGCRGPPVGQTDQAPKVPGDKRLKEARRTGEPIVDIKGGIRRL